MGSHNAEEEMEASSDEEQGGDSTFENKKTTFVKKDLFIQENNGDGNGHGHNTRMEASWGTIIRLGFQCIGIVYGNLGTSPLYVLPTTFPDGIKHQDDIIGVLSLIVYSIIIITLFKYVIVVLAANDNGDGGTFALYTLISRYAKVNLIPNQQAEDRALSNYELVTPNRRKKRATALKTLLENSHVGKYMLLFTTMLGVSMVIGDGILTPSISVLSAVGGIREAVENLSDTTIMWISAATLVVLFQIQRFGTDKIGYSFAPIIVLWFAFISTVGIYNFVKYDPGVIRAFNPWYIVQYFQRNKKDAWISLGGVVMCLTGSEALFADMGHFNLLSIRISACTVLIPSVVLAYFGQSSYLRKFPEDVSSSFYKSIPNSVFWPQFILAIGAAIIASQSLISASFAIVQQSVALGCFPRIKVVHTSAKYEGQVYIPEINTILMIACVGVTLGFKNTLQIGNAYGIAVTCVFIITSATLVIVMIMIWKISIILVILYVLTIGVVELVFLSSVLYKFVEGGYLPLLFSFCLVTIMFTWSYGYRKKYIFELENKISIDRITEMVSDPRIHRVEGLGLFYSQLVQGVSPIFTHYVSSVPALHRVLVFVSIKSVPIGKVLPQERFLFQRVKQGEMIFRCFVRYGYTDAGEDTEAFEEMLVNQLKEFIKNENFGSDGEVVHREWQLIDNAMNHGVVYLLGEGEVMAAKGSSFAKRFTLDYAYNWLSRCVRQPDEVFLIPRRRMLKVGMTYEV